MNKKIPLIIATLSIVAAAGGITFGVKANAAKNEALKQIETMQANTGKRPRPEKTEDDKPLVELKDINKIGTNDVAALQEQLAARDAELARMREMLANRRNPQERQARTSFQDRMAQLKEEDPERYAEMVQRREEAQQRIRYDQASRMAAFMDMDTSNMTEEELANHNALLAKLSQIWDQTEDMDIMAAMSDPESRREMFSTMREVGQMMDAERTVMFKQLGSEVGLDSSESEEFAAYVESIIKTTSIGGGRGMRGVPPGGGN
ncbi:MAG: hypothetical protein JXR25_04060 [Pontiellaceae bacterium]|nr:hypothetical protein [Pontiellaceae bacterium]MBN2783977.1 hypothetical protein [Pontiellaceae bacterium]